MRLVLLAALVAAAGCVTAPQPEPASSGEPPGLDGRVLAVTSSAFAPGAEIPTRHSCDAENVSPPLAFGNVSASATTLALIMEDPDAPRGTVLHWTFWDVPANQTLLREAVDVEGLDGTQGQAYRGPCPPDGRHRYFFYAYAVGGTLGLPAGSGVEDLRQALDGRMLQAAEMFGTYCRPRAPAVGCLLP